MNEVCIINYTIFLFYSIVFLRYNVLINKKYKKRTN